MDLCGGVPFAQDAVTSAKVNKSKGTLYVNSDGKWVDLMALSAPTRTLKANSTFTFLVHQNDDGVLTLGVRLTSPDKVDYDLYLDNLDSLKSPKTLMETLKLSKDIKEDAWVSNCSVLTDKFGTKRQLDITVPAK